MRDACIGKRCAGAALLLGAWFMVAPPETVTYLTCKRVVHDDVPSRGLEAGIPSGIQQRGSVRGNPCRTTTARDEPQRIAQSKEYREGINRDYNAQTPLVWKLVARLFVGCPGTDADWFPDDYYSRTRCAYIEHDEQYRMKEPPGTAR